MNRATFYTQRHGGRWRTARVEHRCDWKHDGLRCRNHVRPGERYFDTGTINPSSRSPHAHYRICTDCANEEIKL